MTTKKKSPPKSENIKDKEALRKEFHTQLSVLAEKIMSGAPDEERRDQLVKVLKPLYELCPVKYDISVEELVQLGYGNPGPQWPKEALNRRNPSKDAKKGGPVEIDFADGLRQEPDRERKKIEDPSAEPNPGVPASTFDYRGVLETKSEPRVKLPTKAEIITQRILECRDNEQTEKPEDLNTCFVICRISVDSLPKPNAMDSIHSNDGRTVCHIAVGEEFVLLTVHRSIGEQRKLLLVLNGSKEEKWLKGNTKGEPNNYSSTFKLRRTDLKAGTDITVYEKKA